MRFDRFEERSVRANEGLVEEKLIDEKELKARMEELNKHFVTKVSSKNGYYGNVEEFTEEEIKNMPWLRRNRNEL